MLEGIIEIFDLTYSLILTLAGFLIELVVWFYALTSKFAYFLFAFHFTILYIGLAIFFIWLAFFLLFVFIKRMAKIFKR